MILTLPKIIIVLTSPRGKEKKKKRDKRKETKKRKRKNTHINEKRAFRCSMLLRAFPTYHKISPLYASLTDRHNLLVQQAFLNENFYVA
jgi:hypothetical protein